MQLFQFLTKLAIGIDHKQLIYAVCKRLKARCATMDDKQDKHVTMQDRD